MKMINKEKSSNFPKGYKVLSIQLSPTSKSKHEIFMKEHSVRNQEDDKPIGRTLFMINVPPLVTEESLKHALRAFEIESLTFTKIIQESSGFKSAFVVFAKEADLHKLLSIKTLPPLSSPEHPITTGILKWIKCYNNTATTQKTREEAALEKIRNYDAAEELKKLKEKTGDVDDEGWTVVTKKGRNPGISRKESVHNKIQEKLSRKDKVLKNFYRHQIRQEKQNQLATLRKKAEEDKKKILALRQRRAFKPF